MKRNLFAVLFLMALAVVLIACEGASSTNKERDVRLKEDPSYASDVQPIFDKYCLGCHGPVRAMRGLRLDGYEYVIAGSRVGAVVIPYSSTASLLAAGLEAGAMPPKGEKPSANRVKNIFHWIERGAYDN